MAVMVKFFANFREAAGKDQELVEGPVDLASLFDELTRRFGNKFIKQLYSQKEHKIRETVSVLVNGKRADLHHALKTPLKDGDVVAIFPPVAGGK
ncbi:MAG: ubiquitin-like small modifier protein 1 [Methanobacteriota archaeon]